MENFDNYTSYFFIEFADQFNLFEHKHIYSSLKQLF
jgi:hypothetical protein